MTFSAIFTHALDCCLPYYDPRIKKHPEICILIDERILIPFDLFALVIMNYALSSRFANKNLITNPSAIVVISLYFSLVNFVIFVRHIYREEVGEKVLALLVTQMVTSILFSPPNTSTYNITSRDTTMYPI